jgi:hypothetical protein
MKWPFFGLSGSSGSSSSGSFGVERLGIGKLSGKWESASPMDGCVGTDFVCVCTVIVVLNPSAASQRDDGFVWHGCRYQK